MYDVTERFRSSLQLNVLSFFVFTMLLRSFSYDCFLRSLFELRNRYVAVFLLSP
jgi:hypothetical protein